MTLSVKRLSAVLAAALLTACRSGSAAPPSSAAAGGPPQPPVAAHRPVREGLPRWLNAQRPRGHHTARRPHRVAKNP